MELNKLGTAVEFAISIESEMLEAYERQSQSSISSSLKEVLNFLSRGNKERKIRLEALYKELIYSDQDTGIFEPITGLSTYDIRKVTAENYFNVHLAAIAEEQAMAFYQSFAALMKSRRRDLNKMFGELATENSDRREKLLSSQSTE